MLPAILPPCPVSDGHLSFHQRKERWERNAARNRWFLDFLARATCGKTGLVSATRTGVYLSVTKCGIAPASNSLSRLSLQNTEPFSSIFKPLAQLIAFDTQKGDNTEVLSPFLLSFFAKTIQLLLCSRLQCANMTVRIAIARHPVKLTEKLSDKFGFDGGV